MRKIARTLLGLLAVIVVQQIIETALTVWAMRSRNPRALHLIKRYYKYVENPLVLRFAGRSGFTAIVHHVGRRSGTQYSTPVIAHQSSQDVIIPLPYGTEVDWLRNLLAAGEGVVDLEGRSLQVDEPAVVSIADLVDLFPAPMLRIVRLNGAREALRAGLGASRAGVGVTGKTRSCARGPVPHRTGQCAGRQSQTRGASQARGRPQVTGLPN